MDIGVLLKSLDKMKRKINLNTVLFQVYKVQLLYFRYLDQPSTVIFFDPQVNLKLK